MSTRKPSRRVRSRAGFTLAELMVVIVIVGVLATIAIPKFAEAKTKAYTASAQSDLRNLVVAQDTYFDDHRTYTGDLGDLDATPSNDITLVVHEHSATGWSAIATYRNGQCAIYYGSAAPLFPATVSAVASCS